MAATNVTVYAQWEEDSPDFVKWMNAGRYYMEGVQLSYGNKLDVATLTSQTFLTMAADNTKTATIMQLVKPLVNRDVPDPAEVTTKIRSIVRPESGIFYAYSIYDTDKTYMKTPLTDPPGSGATTDPGTIITTRGTDTVARGTKWMKTLPYVQYQVKDGVTRYYTEGKAVYAYESWALATPNQVMDMVLFKSNGEPPASLFEPNVEGYTKLG